MHPTRGLKLGCVAMEGWCGLLPIGSHHALSTASPTMLVVLMLHRLLNRRNLLVQLNQRHHHPLLHPLPHPQEVYQLLPYWELCVLPASSTFEVIPQLASALLVVQRKVNVFKYLLKNNMLHTLGFKSECVAHKDECGWFRLFSRLAPHMAKVMSARWNQDKTHNLQRLLPSESHHHHHHHQHGFKRHFLHQQQQWCESQRIRFAFCSWTIVFCDTRTTWSIALEQNGMGHWFWNAWRNGRHCMSSRNCTSHQVRCQWPVWRKQLCQRCQLRCFESWLRWNRNSVFALAIRCSTSRSACAARTSVGKEWKDRVDQLWSSFALSTTGSMCVILLSICGNSLLQCGSNRWAAAFRF